MDIEEAIENLYDVFSKYTPSDMHYCKCGCIKEIEVQKLASKPLKQLEEEHFAYYHGSAVYTWGDVEHYKHFLPRILEVYHLKKGRAIIDLFEISTKLEGVDWHKWDVLEIDAIKGFVLANWISLTREEKQIIDVEDLKDYTFFHRLESLLQHWQLSSDENGLRNFVHFFYQNGSVILDKGIKIRGISYKDEFLNKLNQPEVLKRLEQIFFHEFDGDKSYADKISVVLQMIEQA